jgi:transposase-like protein
MVSGAARAGDSQYATAEKLLHGLRTGTTWVASYKFREFDCSIQSTTLWHLLKEKGIKAKIVYAVSFDEKDRLRRDHAFLIAELDGKTHSIEATVLEIRDTRFLYHGYYVIGLYDSPDEAGREWPAEFLRWDLSRLRKRE